MQAISHAFHRTGARLQHRLRHFSLSKLLEQQKAEESWDMLGSAHSFEIRMH